MSEPAVRLITDELAAKVEKLFAERGAAGIDAHVLAAALAKHGIGLVDTTRDRCWVDERIYTDALFRGHQAEAVAVFVRAEADLLASHLQLAVKVAGLAAAEWDAAPDGMRAGKVILALAGRVPGYRQDTDAIHQLLTGFALRGFFNVLGAWFASIDISEAQP